MARPKTSQPQPKPAPQSAAPAGPVDAATAEQTTDYTRRAGGYVLTDRGWVIGDEAD